MTKRFFTLLPPPSSFFLLPSLRLIPFAFLYPPYTVFEAEDSLSFVFFILPSYYYLYLAGGACHWERKAYPLEEKRIFLWQKLSDGWATAVGCSQTYYYYISCPSYHDEEGITYFIILVMCKHIRRSW